MQFRGTDAIIEVKIITQEKYLAKECRVSFFQMPLLSPAFTIFHVLLDLLIHIETYCNISCL